MTRAALQDCIQAIKDDFVYIEKHLNGRVSDSFSFDLKELEKAQKIISRLTETLNEKA